MTMTEIVTTRLGHRIRRTASVALRDHRTVREDISFSFPKVMDKTREATLAAWSRRQQATEEGVGYLGATRPMAD